MLEKLQWGHVCSDPFVPFPHDANDWFPYFHANLSQTEDTQICKLVIIASDIHVHVCIEFCCFSCAISALFVSVVSYHVIVNEVIEGTRIWLVKLGGYFSIGFSET